MNLLQARLKRLEPQIDAVRFVEILLQVRDSILGEAETSRLTRQGFAEHVTNAIRKGSRPLLDEDVLNGLNYEAYSGIIVKLLHRLRERGVGNGEMEAMIQGLYTNPFYAKDLLMVSLGVMNYEILRLDIEPEVLSLITLTPLTRLMKLINQLNSRTDSPIYVRSCLTCGKNYSLGVYRNGFRFMMCGLCGNIVRVDFFYCPRCGSTDPNMMRFIRLHDEPYLQIEICDKCKAYYKMVNEDVIGVTVDDQILLDMATIDLDNIALSIVGAKKLDNRMKR